MEQSRLDFGTVLGGAGRKPPPGLTYEREAISPSVERDLLLAIGAHPWSTVLRRRVQHYGWRYDYKSRRVKAEAYLGPLPNFLDPVVSVLQNRWFTPDQAIINEYEPGQGIAPHIDCEPCFGPTIAMIGLAGSVQMDFDHADSGERWSTLFERRSLLVLQGEARYRWKHSIAKRRSDPTFGLARGRRVSITFRSVNVDT